MGFFRADIKILKHREPNAKSTQNRDLLIAKTDKIW
jgi:hypothetical protein